MLEMGGLVRGEDKERVRSLATPGEDVQGDAEQHQDNRPSNPPHRWDEVPSQAQEQLAAVVGNVALVDQTGLVIEEAPTERPHAGEEDEVVRKAPARR